MSTGPNSDLDVYGEPIQTSNPTPAEFHPSRTELEGDPEARDLVRDLMERLRALVDRTRSKVS